MQSRFMKSRWWLLLFSIAALAPASAWAEAPADTRAPLPKGSWNFYPSEVTGGGLATEIAVSPWPQQSDDATVGGDSWGLYNTSQAGDLWLPAMKSSPHNPMTGENGTFYYSGLAYSKNPHQKDVVYGLLGRCAPLKNNRGGFITVKGDTVVKLDTSGPSGSEPKCNRHEHPRPTGNRVVVDWDAQAQQEYLYVAGGNGTGVWRLEPGKQSFVPLALADKKPIITGMALFPGDNDKLVVATRRTTGPQKQSILYILSNIRSTDNKAAVTAVDLDKLKPGLQFEEVATLGDTLYAAARRHGVYTMTSSDGRVWAPTSGNIPSTVDVVAVGGDAKGSLVFAGCVADKNTPHCIYRRRAGEQAWTPVADKPDFTEWGSNQTWWHSTSGAAMINGEAYVTSQIAVATNGTTVYVAGRAGVWKSEDSGTTWRPAVVGLGGTMHKSITLAGANLVADDVDFCFESSPVSDHFMDSAHITSPGSSSSKVCKQKVKCGGSQRALMITLNGQHITLKPPQDDGTPAQFLVGDTDEATEWFKAQVIKPTALLYKDGVLHIVQCGGGIVLGKQA